MFVVYTIEKKNKNSKLGKTCFIEDASLVYDTDMSKSVQDLMMERFKKPKKRGGIQGPWHDAVVQVHETITDQVDRNGKPYELKDWMWRLKKLDPFFILECLYVAKKNKNPGKHFNWLLRHKK